MHTNLGLDHQEIDSTKFHSSCCLHTISFKFFESGEFYPALTFGKFIWIIRSRIGTVDDCYILSSTSIKTTLMPFSDRSSLQMVFKIDECKEDLNENEKIELAGFWKQRKVPRIPFFSDLPSNSITNGVLNAEIKIID